MGEWRLRLPEVIVVLQNSVRPPTEFLIGAVKLELSIICQMCLLSVILTFRSGGRKRKMANFDNEVLCFDSAPEETLKCLSEFNMFRALKLGKKWSNFCTGLWRETFELSCRLSASPYCLWSTGISIFDRINGSYAHGLSFGGYRVRQRSTRICVSRERFGEAIFFSSMKKKKPDSFTRVCRFASNKIWRVNRRVHLIVPSNYRLRSNESWN